MVTSSRFFDTFVWLPIERFTELQTGDWEDVALDAERQLQERWYNRFGTDMSV